MVIGASPFTHKLCLSASRNFPACSQPTGGGIFFAVIKILYLQELPSSDLTDAADTWDCLLEGERATSGKDSSA